MMEAKFGDISTDFTCSALVNELTKFILYSKQQIPFSYDSLRHAVFRRRKKGDIPIKQLTTSEKLFKSAEKCVDSLEEIFGEIAKQFSQDDVQTMEVAYLFGGSILSPKQIYRITLPKMELGHLPRNHSERLIMADVLRAIVDSDALQKMLSVPLEPTNMYLLFKIRGSRKTEEWLLPKPRFNIPSYGQHINLQLLFESTVSKPCCCKNFNVFCDSEASINISLADDSITETKIISEATETELWYQAPIVFRGFKDIYVKGISVSKSWITSNSI